MKTKKQNGYFDYAGNQIKEGMKILLISTKSPEHAISGRPAVMFPLDKSKFPFMRDGKLIPQTEDVDVKVPSNDNSNSMHFPEADEWRVILEYDIVWSDVFPGVLYAKATGTEWSFSNPLSELIGKLNKNQIIAIRGLSDKCLKK